MAHLAPSILAADFSRLGEQVLQTERAGVQRIQIDVMDGHFVPNLSMGPGVVKSLRGATRMELEVHLMIKEPFQFADDFLAAGTDRLIFHIEVQPNPRPLLRYLHARGIQAGVAIKPETPLEILEPYLPDMDLALCMTVHPGFGGQSFLPESLARIRQLRQLIDKRNPRCELEVDGGIDKTTIRGAHEAGANVFVAGTAVFGAPHGPAHAVRELMQLLGKG
ncbi:MAG: ribulose-phosphate 3-epimerase [Gemmataceae bacterium]